MTLPYNNLGHFRGKGLYKYTFTFYFFIDLTNIEGTVVGCSVLLMMIEVGQGTIRTRGTGIGDLPRP